MASEAAWAPFSAHYKVHQESKNLVDLLIQKEARPFSTYSLDEARKKFHDICVTAGGSASDFKGQADQISIPSPHSPTGLPATVIRPEKLAAKPAILVYFHGGGLVLFDRDCFDSALKKIASASGSIIVNVEYRRLPDESKGYGPFDDGVTVTRWVLENKTKIGGQPGSKVGVGGDSSGGQVAISVTNDVAGLDFQVLIYPHCDTSVSKPSVKEFETVPILPKVDLDWFINLVKKDLPNQETDPRVCPLARTNLKSVPPALILHAQLDTLRDGGVTFAEKLKASGVKVKAVMIEGVPHIFFGMCAVFKTKCAEAYDHVVKFLEEFQ